ncbi:hypothetical protein METBIDRAFT_86849 [Metschnikowia bicuspidata var. bicuspidata NRRL YB-4993]|uniref:Nuclear segregation protein BFR1 n=1 Tax=Metschnikowia bicuspidata var. bicuspidata NRRL YB-4993 TaxID=869754 RepID=A0A1A0HE93_9ASCO|nr:hypothetical protein METBIDRAFT_86849 [Metschnikowia bicuspidata var. bicuspidata NRRL YB-4993]OBA22223.1 hypothetical protein METBIDRAFT_86849 [Metschnikowia bicuspidata var. bicuspidata NRRL YB-4993]
MSTTQKPRRFIKRPDDKALKERIDVLRTEIKTLDQNNVEINAQIEKAVLDSGVAEKKKTLQANLKDIIAKQGKLKQERNTIQEQIKNVDVNLKRKIAEIQKLTAKNNFKSTSEIDARIKSLDDLVGSGSLILAEERKYIKEMSSLRKLRKDFTEVEKQQVAIDNDKGKIAELKQKLASVGNKEVQKQFEETQKELDVIYDSNKSLYNKRSELIAKRNANSKSKDEKYNEIRTLKADFDAEFAKFKANLAAEQKKRDEETKSEREAEKKAKLKERAESRLAEASVPAFSKEINEIESLLSYFDPSYVKPQSNAVAEATKPTLESRNNIRSVEMPSDVIVLKKEQQVFFEGSKSKKTKKKTQKKRNFTVDSDVILSLTNLSIPLPTTTDEVPSTIIILKETMSALRDKQEEQTKLNIEKARKEIEKLEVVSSDDETEQENEDA